MEGGPPCFGRSSTCSALLGVTAWLGRGFRLRGSHPLRPAVPGGSPILSLAASPAPQPRGARSPPRFGLLRFRSPLLAQCRLISSPAGTEMFHFPAYGFGGLSSFIRRRRPVESDGLPHSDTPGSKPDDGSPRILAVFRVLLRLLMPRHPSCARIRLAEPPPQGGGPLP